jgi:hypothetical protein
LKRKQATAEEQPVSNRLSALRCNIFRDSFDAVSFLVRVTDNAIWLKKPKQGKYSRLKKDTRTTFYSKKNIFVPDLKSKIYI